MPTQTEPQTHIDIWRAVPGFHNGIELASGVDARDFGMVVTSDPFQIAGVGAFSDIFLALALQAFRYLSAEWHR